MTNLPPKLLITFLCWPVTAGDCFLTLLDCSLILSFVLAADCCWSRSLRFELVSGASVTEALSSGPEGSSRLSPSTSLSSSSVSQEAVEEVNLDGLSS